jgi:tetratricopeptide (TPR) repeat protein
MGGAGTLRPIGRSIDMPTEPLLSNDGRRPPVAAIVISLLLAGPTWVGAQQSAGPDERAIEVARQALDAIESGWGLAQYDGAQRVRAAINARSGSPTPIGITSNFVVDRTARRWRLDVGGDIGPLTLYADREQMTLFSPDLEQFGGQQTGILTLGDGSDNGLMAQLVETRQRLDRGYGLLRYVSEETVGGARAHRIEDTPAPGTTATYWIDQSTHLPRRAELARPGRNDVRIEFRGQSCRWWRRVHQRRQHRLEPKCLRRVLQFCTACWDPGSSLSTARIGTRFCGRWQVGRDPAARPRESLIAMRSRVVGVVIVPAAVMISTAQGLSQEEEFLADSLVAVLDIAAATLESGDADGAIEEYRRAEGFLGLMLLYGDGSDDLGAETTALRRGLARAYLEAGDPYAAAAEAERGINLLDDDPELWTLLGLARHQLGQLGLARDALDRAIEGDPENPETHWGSALVAIAENDSPSARRHAQRAYDLSPRPTFALGLARWAEVDGDYRAAASALDDYLKLAPDGSHVEGYQRLLRFYRHVGGEPANRIDQRVNRVQLNFDLKRGDEIPYVAVSINGREPAYVLLDTGAERNVIDLEYAQSIGVEPVLPGGRLRGPYRPSRGGYAILDSLGLGSLQVLRVPVAVGDFAALNLRGQGEYYIAGVLNPALLFRDFVVILDYAHRRIELRRNDHESQPYAERATRLRKTVVPFMFDANGVWPLISVSLDGARSLPFIIDTGASDILIGRRTAGILRVDPDSFVASAGDYVGESLRAILIDLPVGDAWSVAAQGILGFPFFRGMRVVFDYREMKLVIES